MIRGVTMQRVFLVLASLLAAPRASAQVRGVVFDSVGMRPLSGAVVQAVQVNNPSQARSAVADSNGRFSLPTLTAGSWALAAMHPRIDSLGLDQIRSAVDVAANGVTDIVVAVPNAIRLTRLLCGEPTMPGDTSGYLTGVVRSATAERAPVAGTVRVEWLELTVTPRGFVRTRETRTAEAGADGRYLACNVPVGGLVRVSAARGADSSGVLDLLIPRDGIEARDVYIGTSHLEPLAALPMALDSATNPATDTDTARVLVRRGDGRLRGRLLGASGAPLANARVVIRDAGLESRTDATGRFAFANLPTGSWNLDVRAVGHDPLTRPVDVIVDDSTAVSYMMSKFLALDTVRIRATLPNNASVSLAAFEERKKAGMGRFMGPAELEALQPLWFSDIALRFPSLRLERAGYGYVITMRATGRAARCAPRVYVDNILTPNDGSLDSYLLANQINAVEVYAGAFGPPQYMDMLSGCGSILVWTGPRPTVTTGAPVKKP